MRKLLAKFFRSYKFFRHKILYRYFRHEWVEIQSLTSSRFYIDINSIIKRKNYLFYNIKEYPENNDFYYLASFMLEYSTCKWGLLSREEVKEYQDGCSSYNPLEFAPKEEVMTRLNNAACDYDLNFVKDLYKNRVGLLNRLLLPILVKN